MLKLIRKIGNSQGLILNKQDLNSIGLNVGDSVKTVVKNGKIIITPTRQS